MRGEVLEFPVIGRVGVADEDHHAALAPGRVDPVRHEGNDPSGLGPHIERPLGVDKIVEHVRHDQGRLPHGRLREKISKDH